MEGSIMKHQKEGESQAFTNLMTNQSISQIITLTYNTLQKSLILGLGGECHIERRKCPQDVRKFMSLKPTHRGRQMSHECWRRAVPQRTHRLKDVPPWYSSTGDSGPRKRNGLKYASRKFLHILTDERKREGELSLPHDTDRGGLPTPNMESRCLTTVKMGEQPLGTHWDREVPLGSLLSDGGRCLLALTGRKTSLGTHWWRRVPLGTYWWSRVPLGTHWWKQMP